MKRIDLLHIFFDMLNTKYKGIKAIMILESIQLLFAYIMEKGSIEAPCNL